MRQIYTNLGAVPARASRSAEKRDPMLAHTGRAARRILYEVKKLPVQWRVGELHRVLAGFDPSMPARVQRVAEFLRRGGMEADAAVERAMALALADVAIEKLQVAGKRVQHGMPAVGMSGLGALGADAGKVAVDMMRGITCSDEIRDLVVNLVGTNEGRTAADATRLGIAAGRGAANCQGLLPQPEPPVSPPPETPKGGSLVLPLAIGAGVLVLVAGVVLVTRKK